MCSSATDMLPMTVIVWRPSVLHRSTHTSGWKRGPRGRCCQCWLVYFASRGTGTNFTVKFQQIICSWIFLHLKPCLTFFFPHVTCANSVNSPNIAPQQPTWEGRADSWNQVSQIYFQNFPGSPVILFTFLLSFSFFLVLSLYERKFNHTATAAQN